VGEFREVGGEFVVRDDAHAGAAFDHGGADIRAVGEHLVSEPSTLLEGEGADGGGSDDGEAVGADALGVKGGQGEAGRRQNDLVVMWQRSRSGRVAVGSDGEFSGDFAILT